MKRRTFLRRTTLATLGASVCSSWVPNGGDASPPVQAITSPPNYHWFGYYDKEQVDPTGRYALGMEVDFRFRSPTADDVIDIGVIDLQRGHQWRKIGESSAWGWQQGCMLQWIPGSEAEVIWNDRADGRFVSHVVNVKTGERRTLPRPIYALSQDGAYAVGTDFRRIQNMRPGYGYPGLDDPNREVKAPKDVGIYRMDLQTGENELIVPLSAVAKTPHRGEDLGDYWHYFNHLLVSPDSERFIFLHRWRETMGERDERATGGWTTRMYTADKNGGDRYILDPSGNTSHFIWRDPTHICAWTKPRGRQWGYYLYEDQTGNIQPVGKGTLTENGHNTYLPLPGKEWILTDTYPDEDRMQTLYLYHVPSDRTVILGRFHSPPRYKGEWRCDLHPRSSPDGTKVIFDSTHEGNGRQMYMIDISDIVEA
jgi:hypothetical protein